MPTEFDEKTLKVIAESFGAGERISNEQESFFNASFRFEKADPAWIYVKTNNGRDGNRHKEVLCAGMIAISRTRELLIIIGSNDVDRPSFNSDRSAVDFLYEYVGSNFIACGNYDRFVNHRREAELEAANKPGPAPPTSVKVKKSEKLDKSEKSEKSEKSAKESKSGQSSETSEKTQTGTDAKPEKKKNADLSAKDHRSAKGAKNSIV
ncbi:unnamed protein product [Bursaphelenchus xylophilus]|uniref:(pine wood nematode) hypothetical protein n=1 Tax=Bursaphelenchus xylophilus TaxID=6326 RepID=A0A811JXQ8_BURXY|nr:unnamed protein product [Bursaphelenchus xylophilus]CAG9079930.1 unnamed protein product [Bursaphelenchus xylophilus]